MRHVSSDVCTSVGEKFSSVIPHASKMADDDPWLLKEDGCLNVDTECKSIIYHANTNVLLITTGSAQVYVFDVNSGVILQRSCLSGKHRRGAIRTVSFLASRTTPGERLMFFFFFFFFLFFIPSSAYSDVCGIVCNGILVKVARTFYKSVAKHKRHATSVALLYLNNFFQVKT